MYVGIDIGGTKTLVAALSDAGDILEKRRFSTAQDYQQFLVELRTNFEALKGLPGLQDGLAGGFRCVAGVPGHLNREEGLVYVLSNLPWRDEPIRDDIAAIVGQPVTIENDSKLAGLSEAQLVKDQYQAVLFATVSTGIGVALVRDGRIVEALRDIEMGSMPLQFEGSYQRWETFASGRGVVARLGKRADEITDEADWRAIAEPLAYGLAIACSTMQPDIIILGGSVGKHTAKFSSYISDFLVEHLHPIVSQPQAIVAAQRPDDAVLYGCYDLARQLEAAKVAETARH